MNRVIVLKDGVFYDEKWNAVTPDLDELMAITAAVYKYTSISINEAMK